MNHETIQQAIDNTDELAPLKTRPLPRPETEYEKRANDIMRTLKRKLQ